jgi:PAS domain S-box-containing protein
MVGEVRPAVLGPVLSAGTTAMVAMDTAGLVTAWDHGATTLFGYPPEQAIGVRLSELIMPVRMRAAHEAGMRRHLRSGTTSMLDTPFDMPAVDRSGREFRVLLLVARDGEQFVGNMHELRSPSPIPAELYLDARGFQRGERVETARMTTLIESLKVGVLLQDEHQRIVLTNSAFVELFARTLSPDSPWSPTPSGGAGTFSHAFADREAAERRIRETVRRGRPITGDEIQLAGGRILERDYVPVTLDGTTLGHLWVFRDITVQAEIRRSLQERNRMLTEISERKTEFVRVASHELRTPLTSIAIFANMLNLADDGTLNAADRHAAVDAIQRNAERMQLLVADLLLLAQLESGETSLRLAPVDVAAVVRAACDDKVLPADIGSGPPIHGDEALLRQLFGTAVGLVAAAADPGAAVDVAASGDATGWTVTVSTETADPATAERLLSTRLPHPEHGGEQRTGALALMLGREIAARHGGTMTSAMERRGMTVTTRLPL